MEDTIRGDKVIVTDVLYTASDIEARLRGKRDVFINLYGEKPS